VIASPSRTTNGRSSAPRRAVAYAERALASPYLAYTAIAVLQMRVLWNIWKYADLTTGDTSYYFVDAASWQHGLHENLVYYPGYDAFWGTILAVVHDVYAAAVIHRLVIILVVTLLVLALMRSLLGPALGLLIAAWWAIIPANYEVLYEVHLLGAVPILLAVLVVARAPRREGVGAAVAILLASAVLVRTELIAAAAILALVLVAYELRELRRGRPGTRSSYLRAYVVPLALALLLIGGAYARSHVQGHEAWSLLQAKEEANFCNVYADAFQQRHPSEFTGNPFTECSPLMQHDFGRPMPTILQATVANPRAVAAFAAWNAQLVPGGLQVGLFGASAFENEPGFRPVIENSTYALVLSIVLLIAIVAGLIAFLHDDAASLRNLSSRTRWIAITLASVAAATVVVALTSRPWSEYIYGLTICALVMVGLAASILSRRVGGTRILAPLALVTVLVLIVTTSSMYGPGRRPIYEGVQHLKVVQHRLQRLGSVLVAGENDNELCNYLAYSFQHICTPMFWPTLLAQQNASTTAGKLLDQAHATALYADASILSDPLIAKLVAAPQAQGWEQVAQGNGPSGPWHVLVPLRQAS
jgi:hypothetical protein